MVRTARFKSAEREDLTTILPWLTRYAEGTATRLQGPAREATGATNLERAALAYWHQGGITVAARGFLAEPRAPGQ